MKTYNKICDVLEKALFWIVATFGSVMIVITTVEVFRRYFFSLSFSWAEELSRFLMVSLAFMGGAIAYRHKDLIPLDLFTGFMSEKVKTAMDFVLEIVCVVITATLFVYSLRTIMQPYVYKQISIGLPISMAIPFASMPLSFGCMMLFSVEHFVGYFKKEKEVK